MLILNFVAIVLLLSFLSLMLYIVIKEKDLEDDEEMVGEKLLTPFFDKYFEPAEKKFANWNTQVKAKLTTLARKRV